MRSISKELIIEYLEDLRARAELVIHRNEAIHTADDYMISPDRMEKFDAACMLIQVIGETAKKIDTWTDGKLLCKYPEVYWRGVFGCRNIISHEYGNVDPEQIHRIIKNHLPELTISITCIINALKAGMHDDLF
jgi:uncharacterized protein with HEPN domain